MNIQKLNLKMLFGHDSCTKIMYSDASSTGYAAYEVSAKHRVIHGMWSSAV